MKKIFYLTVSFAILATAQVYGQPVKVPFTGADFYQNNLGCYKSDTFKPAGYGSGFWTTKGQGTEKGGSGSRVIKIVPLNQEVASALQATPSKLNMYLCLGGSSLGGPYDGQGPNTIFPFSATWKQ